MPSLLPVTYTTHKSWDVSRRPRARNVLLSLSHSIGQLISTLVGESSCGSPTNKRSGWLVLLTKSTLTLTASSALLVAPLQFNRTTACTPPINKGCVRGGCQIDQLFFLPFFLLVLPKRLRRLFMFCFDSFLPISAGVLRKINSF